MMDATIRELLEHLPAGISREQLAFTVLWTMNRITGQYSSRYTRADAEWLTDLLIANGVVTPIN